MLSVPSGHSVSSVVARTSSLPLSSEEYEEGSEVLPEPSAPAIAVIRPSRVSASVDDSALELLRAKYNAQHSHRDRASSLNAHHFARTTNLAARSPHTSPKLERKSSFKVKKLKLFRTPSNGVDGYEALNGEISDEVVFSREKITSVNRVLSRNSSFPSIPSSPRPYRAMSLVPAKHRIVQSDSSDDEEGALTPESESDLDFGSRNRLSQVSNYVPLLALASACRALHWIMLHALLFACTLHAA